MDYTKNPNHHHHPHLGINKLGKSIRKSPLHQPQYHQPPPPQQQQQPPPPPQPQVYNINKNDFRSLVQQLTGTPTRDPLPPPPPAPHHNRPPPPKAASMRLQRIRPPPLTPIARPPPPAVAPIPPPHPNPNPNPNSMPPHFPRPAPQTPPGVAWAESPVTAYMRYLETSIITSDPSRPPRQLPPGPMPPLPSPRANYMPAQLHSPRLLPRTMGNVNYPPPMLSPRLPPFPSPRAAGNANFMANGPQQGVLPSPSAFLNLASPKSPFPLLSPGFQNLPPLSPNFAFSPLPQSGFPGMGQHPPVSPGVFFPPSPSGYFPMPSPRWRDMM